MDAWPEGNAFEDADMILNDAGHSSSFRTKISPNSRTSPLRSPDNVSSFRSPLATKFPGEPPSQATSFLGTHLDSPGSFNTKIDVSPPTVSVPEVSSLPWRGSRQGGAVLKAFADTKRAGVPPVMPPTVLSPGKTSQTTSTDAGSSSRIKSPLNFRTARYESQAPKVSSDSMCSANLEKVDAWQSDMDALGQQQIMIEADRMNLLSHQIHILMRELGDLQSVFTDLRRDITQKVDDLQSNWQVGSEEPYEVLRQELAEHGRDSAELKNIVADIQAQLETITADTNNAVNDLQRERDAAAVEREQSLEGVAYLKQVVENVASQAAAGLAAQEENLAALRVEVGDIHAEVGENGNNIIEMKVTLEEADDSLRCDHIKAVNDHVNSLQALSDAQDAKHLMFDAKHEASTTKLEEELQSILNHTNDKIKENLKDILGDITRQTDYVAESMAQEAELRKAMEVKLNKVFNGLRGMMSARFLDGVNASGKPTSPQR